MHHACPFGLPALGRYNKDIFIRLVARPGLCIYRGDCFLPFSSGKGQHTHTQTTTNNALTSVITIQGGAKRLFSHNVCLCNCAFPKFLLQVFKMFMKHVSCVNINISYFSDNEHGVGLIWLDVCSFIVI